MKKMCLLYLSFLVSIALVGGCGSESAKRKKIVGSWINISQSLDSYHPKLSVKAIVIAEYNDNYYKISLFEDFVTGVPVMNTVAKYSDDSLELESESHPKLVFSSDYQSFNFGKNEWQRLCEGNYYSYSKEEKKSVTEEFLKKNPKVREIENDMKEKAKQDCDTLVQACEKYKEIEGRNVESLLDLKEKYLTNIDRIKDPWNQSYQLDTVAGFVVSNGPDMQSDFLHPEADVNKDNISVSYDK